MPMPWKRQVRHAWVDHRPGLVGFVQPMGQHELHRPRLCSFKACSIHNIDPGSFAQPLQDIKRGVEGAVARGRVVPDPTIPSAVGQLQVKDGLRQRRQPVVTRQERRADAQPEADVAQIEALLEHARRNGASRRQEAGDLHVGSRLQVRQPGGHAALEQQQERPDRRRPASWWPGTIRQLSCNNAAPQPSSGMRACSARHTASGACSTSRSTCERIIGSPCMSQSRIVGSTSMCRASSCISPRLR